MQQKAIEKIQAEMASDKNNTYVQVVGSFLLKHLEENPDDANKIMNSDKTIAKSLDEMRKAAEKKKVGNVGVLTPDEGYAIVLKYYGIGEVEKTDPTPQDQVVETEKAPYEEFDFLL